MKKIYALIISLLVLVSCGVSEKPGVIEETGQILNGYVDTLEGSIGDAKAVTELLNQRQGKLEDSLDVE